MQMQTQGRDRLMKIPEWLLNITYILAMGTRRIARLITRPTEVGVRVLVVQGDEVVLVRHRSGTHPWGLPGGGVKRGEPLEEATCREVLEETGCPVRIERLHGVYHNFRQGFNNYIIVFVCTPLADVQPPVGDIEIADARFFPLRAPIATTDPGSYRRIAEYLRGESGLMGMW